MSKDSKILAALGIGTFFLMAFLLMLVEYASFPAVVAIGLGGGLFAALLIGLLWVILRKEEEYTYTFEEELRDTISDAERKHKRKILRTYLDEDE